MVLTAPALKNFYKSNENKFMATLGDDRFMSKMYDIKRKDIIVGKLKSKCNPSNLSDGVYFSTTSKADLVDKINKRTFKSVANHWYCKKNGSWYDSYKVGVQPVNSAGFCSAWAGTHFSNIYCKTVKTSNAFMYSPESRDDVYRDNAEAMATFLLSRIKAVGLSNDVQDSLSDSNMTLQQFVKFLEYIKTNDDFLDWWLF